MTDLSRPAGDGARDPRARVQQGHPDGPATRRTEVQSLAPVPAVVRDALRASERGDQALASRHGVTTRAVAPEPAEPTDPTERALVDALAEHGILERAAEAVGVSARTATRMARRSPAVASALARARGRAALSLEGVAWGVAAGDVPAEEVELRQVDPETGEERVVWRRRTYRRDPRLLELLLRQHGGAAWAPAAAKVEVEHKKRIVLELDGRGSAVQPPRDAQPEGDPTALGA